MAEPEQKRHERIQISRQCGSYMKSELSYKIIKNAKLNHLQIRCLCRFLFSIIISQTKCYFDEKTGHQKL